jgi:uncharacterized BrkB/YihY/UPF0761 family membrane protein
VTQPDRDEQHLDEPHTRTERARARTAAVQARAARVAERAQAERGRHGSVDAMFEMADRDAEVGGSIIAGALAYRLFIWMLPLALVFVAGFGVAASQASDSPEKAARSPAMMLPPTSASRSLGLAGIVSGSVAGAANSSARWYALLIGIPILLWATRSLLRTLIVMHRLCWTDVRHAAPKATPKATLRLLGLLLCFVAVSAAANYVRSRLPGPGLLVTLALILPYGGLWLLVSMRLPRRDASWIALLPGALLFAVGLEIVGALTAYFIVPEAESKQGTYGALGLAAALLLGLFFLSRLVVATAVLNATLWERRSHSG